MSTIGNIIWFILGGFLGGLLWIIAGLICCITIIGIPLGLQCFKFATVTMFPFGREIVYSDSTGSLLVNVIWIIFIGFEMAAYFFIIGVFYCITIVGIPIGLYSFKMAKLSLMPFGTEVL